MNVGDRVVLTTTVTVRHVFDNLNVAVELDGGRVVVVPLAVLPRSAGLLHKDDRPGSKDWILSRCCAALMDSGGICCQCGALAALWHGGDLGEWRPHIPFIEGNDPPWPLVPECHVGPLAPTYAEHCCQQCHPRHVHQWARWRDPVALSGATAVRCTVCGGRKCDMDDCFEIRHHSVPHSTGRPVGG